MYYYYYYYCGSDHNPVACRMQVKLKILRKAKATPKFQLDTLRKDDVLRKQYAVAVQNKFQILEQVMTVEEKWSQLKECIQDACKEHVPKRPKRNTKSG